MKLQKLYLLLSLLLFFTPVKSENEYTFYSGIFDTIDKEKDDKATIYGLEHNNLALFKKFLTMKIFHCWHLDFYFPSHYLKYDYKNNLFLCL